MTDKLDVSLAVPLQRVSLDASVTTGLLTYTDAPMVASTRQHAIGIGDIALRAVAQLMRTHFRVSDYACRYGGEEFTVIMPEAPLDHARQRAEAFRSAAASLALMHGGRPLRRITVSLGLATMPDGGTTPDALLQSADGALYKAKEGGRDRLVVANG